MSEPKFFALIIGTEILNRRRIDKHFDFVTQALIQKGYKLSGSFIIEDDPGLIIETLNYIASLENSILFSFGGIGSTPDDYTRQCVAYALSDGELITHQEAKIIIEKKLGDNAYPHPIKMAELPKNAKLLHNPINNMPAFSLNERYFFMPGFPEMSHPMVIKILEKLIPHKRTYFRHTLTAHCKENELIEVMEKMPKNVEFSSLPKRHHDGWRVSISVASHDALLAQQSFNMYLLVLQHKNILYSLHNQV